MAKKKFYAVKKGKTPGIYETWNACKSQVDGVSGAEYKGFATLEEAKAYLGNIEDLRSKSLTEEKKDLPENALIAYVDGSYNDVTKQFSYGMVIIDEGEEEHFSEKVEDEALAEMRNVAGEIKGAEAAMRYAVEKSRSVVIYHDYEGIAKWCTGAWQAKKEGTRAYKAYYDSVRNKIDIRFVKVRGHSNDKYNDLADELAKQAIFEDCSSDSSGEEV